MELKPVFADIIAMAAGVGLSHNTFDSAIYLGVCDKIVNQGWSSPAQALVICLRSSYQRAHDIGCFPNDDNGVIVRRKGLPRRKPPAKSFNGLGDGGLHGGGHLRTFTARPTPTRC